MVALRYQRTSSLSCTPPEPLVCPQHLTEGGCNSGLQPYCSNSRWPIIAASAPPATLDIVCLGRASGRRSCLLPPSPAGDLRHIVPIPGDERLVVDELVADGLLGIGSPRTEPRH